MKAAKRPRRGEPRRHQVAELPRIEAHITEYRCERVACPECGKTTQPELPREVRGQFGPELTALVAYLTVVCRMPVTDRLKTSKYEHQPGLGWATLRSLTEILEAAAVAEAQR